MELVKPMTIAQRFNQQGEFWGRNIQEIEMGDQFKFRDSTFVVEDVYCAEGRARIITSSAVRYLHGKEQRAPQWFNEDAKIEWI